MEVRFTIPECVIKPERSDKPHRRLAMEVIANTDHPHYMEVYVRDNGTTVFEADFHLSDLKAIVHFLDEAYYINKREDDKFASPVDTVAIADKELAAAKVEATLVAAGIAVINDEGDNQ